MASETSARIVIDRLLREAGWDIENPSQVSTEQASADGRADYLLKNQRTQPLCVIEAKRFSVDPYSAKGQAKAYAVELGAPFVVLSNGREHYFWDYESGDARPIVGLPTPADLERRANLRQHRQGDFQTSLKAVPIPRRFRSQGEDCETRPYQIKCLETADEALIAGRRRMLFEMATGTGKTMTIALLIKRWFQAGIISRVLFLADRIELARQAEEDFKDYLRDYPVTLLYGGKRSLEGQVVVGTLDTIASQLGAGGFGHAYFDLVITDECHRSIYNTHRATLGHFDAIHIGLTATPNPGELRWISHHERQLVRSTYMFFDCWDSAREEGRPTFGYTIQEGVTDKFLADYRIYVAETRLTFDGVNWEDEDYGFADWGKLIESEDRLKLIIDEYFRVEEERTQLHPRKTIVFAVGQRQADILARLFNRLLPDAACLRIAQQTNRSPGEVRESFAKTITCYANNNNPKPVIDAFKFDPLPVIAVSVDMLDTGYNHKEVENLVMLRPTSSALKYAQMRGRGSRLCPRIGKTSFLIYDFVNNHARFNDPGQQYHRPRPVGRRPGEPGGDDGGGDIVDPPPPPPPPPPREFTTIKEGELTDEFRRRELIIVGPEGLAIDRREYQDHFRERIAVLQRTHPAVEKVLSGQPLSEEEWDDLRHTLNSPQFYFDEAALRKAFDQPTGSLTDFIRAALGLIKLPTREERVERAFNTWLAEHSNADKPEQGRLLELLRNVVLSALKENRFLDLTPTLFTKPPFTFLGGRVRAESLFGRDGLQSVLTELDAIVKAA
ncbi:MAG: DEAD/DEAH box helicase family protein [Verrucomicrobiaceae bacterium]